MRRGNHNYSELNLQWLSFPSRPETSKNHPFPTASAMEGSPHITLEHMGQSGGTVQSLCWAAEMPTNQWKSRRIRKVKPL